MAHLSPFQSMDIDSMMDAVSSIFSELNIGLLIYHLEEEDNPRSLKLLYANRVASTYTGADLSERVGRHIVDAFPALANSHLPEVFSDVAVSGRSRSIGAFEYRGDDDVRQGFYSVKAFPMPRQCVGVVFENITARKQLEELVKKQRSRGSE